PPGQPPGRGKSTVVPHAPPSASEGVATWAIAGFQPGLVARMAESQAVPLAAVGVVALWAARGVLHPVRAGADPTARARAAEPAQAVGGERAAGRVGAAAADRQLGPLSGGRAGQWHARPASNDAAADPFDRPREVVGIIPDRPMACGAPPPAGCGRRGTGP